MVTSAIAHSVTTRRARPSKRDIDDGVELRSMSGELLLELRAELAETAGVRFPNPIYQNNPVGFCYNVLGFEPWSKQVEILEAVRDHDRVAIVSGHKTGKSRSAAGLGLWFYCSFEDARVVMSSTTARQVDAILWRELRMMRARSGRCVDCKAADPEGFLIPAPCEHSAIIEGELGDLARTGLKSADFREIVGFTAREAEAVAGISGSRLLFILDEASGIPDLIFEAIEGNRAGGAKIVMFSNGTRNEGEFFEAFHSKSQLYHTIAVSSEETPNAVSGKALIPGLATRAYCDEKAEEWGVKSAQYIIRVKGGFALGEDKKIFSTHMIVEAEKRWFDASDAGRLFLGIDPAGETGTGDDSALTARRGRKQILMQVRIGLTIEDHLVWILKTISDLELHRETPVVVIDREGKIGSDLHIKLQQYLEREEFRHAPPFELVSVRASDKAQRRPHIYDRTRDELAKNLEEWMNDDGAILTDTKLAKELHQPQWIQARNGKYKVTPKDEIRKAIGRSPDRFDSLALAVWEPRSLMTVSEHDAGPPSPSPAKGEQRRPANDNGRELDEIDDLAAGETFDPYTGSDPFRR